MAAVRERSLPRARWLPMSAQQLAPALLVALSQALPMEAQSASELPSGAGWRFEPKWDGFRCLARKHGRKVDLTAKSGKPLGRYFPEVVELVARLPADRFTLDGELLVAAEGSWSFEALQARLHPAESRIHKLSAETPAAYMLFDMLEDAGKDLRRLDLTRRRKHLEAFADRIGLGGIGGALALSPGTTDRRTAQRWLASGKYEGVVAKRVDGPYLAGERAMIKVKRRRTADCVVGGFRYATASKLVGSLLLGLYNEEGKLDHVGFTSGFAAFDRNELTKTLEALRGGEGFTGAAPGGQSRWSTERSTQWVPLKPRLVVEVSYDHVSTHRFRHGTRLIRFRPDKAPSQCRMDQIV
jgi:ATP-dependent DNA ligase